MGGIIRPELFRALANRGIGCQLDVEQVKKLRGMAKAIKWSDLEVVKVLGEGRAGTVWLAHLKHEFMGFPVESKVAVKCYKSWVLEEPGQYERIIRELEVGRKIQHPNLVKTLSIIRDPDGKPALVMAYYAGETLESYLERIRSKKTPYEPEKLSDALTSGETLENYLDKVWSKEEHVPLEVSFKIIGDLASAISAVHQAGAIHRDIKPANIILSDTGPILMDFGVISSRDFPEQTTSGEFLGTIRYAAPEYLFGQNYNSNIDVYALGAIAFELFGERRFPSEETQWARLVVEKTKQGIRLNYPALQRHYGLNATELIKFILEKTLAKAEERTISLSVLSEIIKSRLWERPFHITNGILVEGEPKVPYLGTSDEESPTDLQQVVDDLRKKLSEDDREYLRQLLAKEYHTYPDRRYPNELFDIPHTHSLVKAGCLADGGGLARLDDMEPAWYLVHEAVIAAYRYGYL